MDTKPRGPRIRCPSALRRPASPSVGNRKVDMASTQMQSAPPPTTAWALSSRPQGPFCTGGGRTAQGPMDTRRVSSSRPHMHGQDTGSTAISSIAVNIHVSTKAPTTSRPGSTPPPCICLVRVFVCVHTCAHTRLETRKQPPASFLGAIHLGFSGRVSHWDLIHC